LAAATNAAALSILLNFDTQKIKTILKWEQCSCSTLLTKRKILFQAAEQQLATLLTVF